MCIGNTTSPAANNTTNVSWGEPWDRPDPREIGPLPEVQKKESLKASGKKTSPRAPGNRSQSSRTSGGTY